MAQVTKDISWTPPTTFENGDSLVDTNIAQYTYRCSNNNGNTFDFYTVDIANTGSVITFTTDAVYMPGQYQCNLTVWAAHPSDGVVRESDPSNDVVFTVGQCETEDCRPSPAVLQLVRLNGHLSLSVRVLNKV